MLADEPFVASPVGSEPQARILADALAAELGLPPPELMRAAMNAIYAAGGTVIRVGRPTAAAESAYDLADGLRDCSIRVPRPAGGRSLVSGDDGLVATAW